MIDLKQLAQAKIETVHIAALGGDIRLKAMQAREHLLIEQLFVGMQNKGTEATKPIELAAAYTRLCVVDENGQAIFDADTVWDLPPDVLYSIYGEITQRAESISKERVEAAAKN